MGPSGISYFVYDKSCKQIKLLECDALALCLFKHEAKWNKLFFCLWQIPQKYAAHAWLHFTHVWLLGQSDCSFPTTEETHDVSFNEQICFPRIILAGPRKRKRNWNATLWRVLFPLKLVQLLLLLMMIAVCVWHCVRSVGRSNNSLH